MEFHPAKETGGQSRHAARSPIPREYLGTTPGSHWLRVALELPAAEVGKVSMHK